MTDQTLICPHCGKEIPLTAALTGRLEERVQSRIRQETELVLKDKAREAEELRGQNKTLQEQILGLTREMRALRKSETERELEMQKKLTAEEEKIKDESRRKAEEEYRLKILEGEKRLAEAKAANDELRRKLEQGSQQTQGEVQELLLEDILRREFPQDRISPVVKGARGGDTIQMVVDKNGRESGTILWESKQTKAWSEGWAGKLKEDQRAAGADLAVLASSVLPAKVSGLGFYNGIWVTSLSNAVGACWILRYHLIAAASIRQAAASRGEKKDELYDYVTGSAFARRVEAMMDAYRDLLEDAEKEKRWFTAKWAKQEKSIRTLMDQTGTIHGELSGIVGPALPKVKSLELGAG